MLRKSFPHFALRIEEGHGARRSSDRSPNSTLRHPPIVLVTRVDRGTISLHVYGSMRD